MAWGKVQQGWGKANRTNASTCKIIFQDIRPAEEYSKIFIQSKTSDKRERKHLAGTLEGSRRWPIKRCGHYFFTTTRELMKLCFFLWSLVSISCQFLWITVYAMDSRTLHVTGSLKGTLREISEGRSSWPSGWLLGKAPSRRKTFWDKPNNSRDEPIISR